MENIEDKIQLEGIQSMGYGIMPKAVTKDKRLTIEAKAIYAYFVSYAGAGNSAFPKLATILEDLCIGEKRFYKHRKLLLDYGYISVQAFRNEKAIIYKNLYTLHTNPISKTSEDTGTVKMTDRCIRQNDRDKLLLTKDNINIDDDDINKKENSLEKIQLLIQENEVIKYLAQELISMSIAETDILAILQFFAIDTSLIKPGIIQQQLKWCEQKKQTDTGISSFSTYFINGYKQRLQHQEIEVPDDFASNLQQMLGLETEELPVIPMFNWLNQ